jgi:hypothetical protein
MDFFKFVTFADVLFVSSNADIQTELSTSFLIGALCFAIVYILQAVALYTIAKHNGYGNRWMAFVPFFNLYYMGVLADKNKIFNVSAKTYSTALAILEVIAVVLYVLYYVSCALIFFGGYAQEVTTTSIFLGVEMETISYAPYHLPEGLTWAWWVYENINKYILSWFEVVYLAVYLCVLMAFFQTYSAKRYVLFAITSALFPIGGIFMFVVRNNAGKNYHEYLREQQQRQYEMYQMYNRQQGGNPYNYNPYSGRTTPPQGNPYSNQSHTAGSGDDPFGEFGTGNSTNNQSPDDDPFDEFKN